MDIKERKKGIRLTIKELKKSEIPARGEELSARIQKKLLEMDEVKSSATILLYHSLPDEVSTHSLIATLAAEGKRVILPLVSGNDLILKEYSPNSLKEGYCKIMEPVNEETVIPEEIDLAIVPGVAFDKNCNRLGRGKGFYDRLLPKLKCKTIGLSFGFQLVDEIPCESFDTPLDYVITEENVYRCPLNSI